MVRRLALLAGSLLVFACNADPVGILFDLDEDGIPDDADCAPERADTYLGAPDPYGDGLDQDCDGCENGAGDGIDRDCDGYPANLDLPQDAAHLVDCDDNDSEVHPGIPDMVGDALDSNCDGHDGGDNDGDGFASLESMGTDCDDAAAEVFPGAPELCSDGIDGDCNGVTDDRDVDGDGSIDEACGGADCDDLDDGVGPFAVELCGGSIDEDCTGSVDDLDEDFDGFLAEDCGGLDCDDGDPQVHPGAVELCDSVDRDCSGVANDVDVDGDGASSTACGGLDCDDSNPIVYPGAEELPDALDNDCDGAVDEGTNLADDDGDGFAEADGDCADDAADVYPGAPEDGGSGDGLGNGVDDDCDGIIDNGMLDHDDDGDGLSELEGDCDDTSPFVAPGAAESCNGVDDDCSGTADDLDLDGDGHSPLACGGDDCDDLASTVLPGADELPDSLDNDCDGVVDEGTTLYDDDLDGFTELEGDCDDSEAGVFPFAVELCNGGTDDDCDPATDENADLDGDAVGPCDGDCDDQDASVGPDAVELCGGGDEDCDGVFDEDCVTCDVVVPGGAATIQEAIDGATSGTVVCVEPGSYFENLDLGAATLQLRGTGGAASTVLDGGGLGSVLTIAGGQDEQTLVTGFTLTGGQAVAGGGVFVDGASPTLSSLVVSGNSADSGGGMELRSSSSLVGSVEVAGNDATQGGGIRIAEGGSVTLDGLLIELNVAGFEGCGGIAIDGSDPLIVRTTISNNLSTTGDGGGICALDSSPTLDGVILTANGAPTGFGGGLYVFGASSPVATNLTVNSNWANSGGGIAVRSATGTSYFANLRVVDNLGEGLFVWLASAVVTNAIFAGNIDVSGFQSGDAIDVGSGSVILDQATVVGNDRGMYAWGIDPSITVTNSSLTSNGASAGNCGGIRVGVESATVSISHTNLWENVGDPFDCAPFQPWAGGNLSLTPGLLDTDSADPLAWDLHIDTSSDLVDAGDGNANDPDGGPNDIGAYGGPGAAFWDQDGDGSPLWWQPGPYDPTAYPGLGWDCDDADPLVTPAAGCS